jgi:DNA-binding transcriptional ArsR family regulator
MEPLEALGDATRRDILDLLAAVGEMEAGQIAAEFPVSRPAISRHLRVLREHGLVQVRRDAQRRMYSLDARPLREVDRWLEPYRRFWSDRLNALEAHIRETR